MNELALFAGGGGGILGGLLLGWRTRCAVELDPYARRVLLARQRDGMLPKFPIWDDVSTFDGKPWRGHIDVISGGFPCQDISSAGSGAGITGKRSGLWSEMARIVGEVVPRFVFVENSPMLTARGLGVVLGDLASMGYDARWGVLGAHHAGAPHKRDRIWILADASSRRRGEQKKGKIQQSRRAEAICTGSSGTAGLVSNPECLNPLEQSQLKPRRSGAVDSARHGRQEHLAHAHLSGSSWWEAEPAVGRVANGVANRMDRLRALGNGQVPAVAALAWRILS